MEAAPVLISVVIPVKNGDKWLEQLCDQLMRQTLFRQSEIIMIDSGSTDRSLEIIRQYPVKLVEIPSTAYNHGDTRNLGVREAKGKYVVMTVQDAQPASDLWLQYLLDGFVNENVAGVCGQQIVPHDRDKNPVLWFRPISTPQKTFVHFDDPAEFLKLDIREQRRNIGWDNVTAAYRRDLLLQFPFPRIDFAEDMSWAKEMLLKGYTLAYVDEARVFHYHHQTPEFILPRYFAQYYFEYKIFGLQPKPIKSILKNVLISMKILLKESKISWSAKLKWLVFNTRYWLTLKKTTAIFNRSVGKGEAFLDIKYQEICKKAPQAPKY